VAAVLARRAGADDGALAFRPRNDVVVLERLAPDLLSGYAGLAVVLADAAALLGDRLLADQARALAVRVEEVLRRALPGLRVSSPRVALDPGAYCGLGALIYALGRVEAALGRADSRWRAEVAAELAGGDAVEHAAQHHGWDMSIATGTAGLVLALHATALSPGLAQWWPGFAMRTLSLSPGPDTGTHPIAAWFLPSAAASAEFTAAALGTSLPAGLSPPGTARAEQAVRVADRLLARVAAADRDGLAAASRAMAAAPGSWTSLAALCEIEAGLAAVGPAADAGTQLAERAAHLLVARKARTGTWFPEAVAPDRYRLSALWGLGAVCHAFVRLAAPSPVPSIRLIPRCRSAPAQPGLGAASGPLPQ
jgi:hypothetical protein